MNMISIMGRLTRDPELTTSQSGVDVQIQRRGGPAEGQERK